ncbi:RHS repeat domain-containing protein [Ralstonia pseudosolanacearum]|uniref:RHS repeat protein n=1 Tax=Ralstonia solanacearum TaxID=305 RepID=A0AA92EAL4_RALSL|nr:RHS repeat domain-containing protein [Ralstonia pseudosolanacearum]QCX47936.1 RHS repeat protein [Ralstonia pseudosolanacearum]
MKQFVARQIGAAVLSLGCASTVNAAGAIGHQWQSAGGDWPVADSAEAVCAKVAARFAADTGVDWTLASTDYRSDGMAGWCIGRRTMYPGVMGESRLAIFFVLKDKCATGYTLQADGSCESRPPVQVCPVGNPVIPGAGTKTDFEPNDSGSAELPITLAYRSNSVYGSGAGGGQWTLNWQRSLDTSLAAYPTAPQVTVQRDDGSASTFTQNGTAWSASSTQDTLQPVTDASGNTTGWQYTVVDTGAVETYDAKGKLQSVRDRNGRTTTLSYNAANQLTTVTAPSGRSLSFAYDSQNRVASVTAPNGAVTGYGYNSVGMLSTITRPDGAVRQYVYEDSRFPTALTGIVDENGNRYATYAYDDQGRAISSTLAGGANAYQFQYGDNYQTTVTDPTGKTSVYSFLKQNGVLLPASISAPCGLCGSTRKSSSYDANNNLIQETDYNGTVTTHTYDSQKRETQRVDGSGTTSARTTTTVWHSQFWNLPTQIASPTKLETYSYDSNGNLTSYSETPTADSDGSQGFSATTTGSARTTNWTYTADGLVATSSGPRTDVATSTTYVYRTADDTNSPPQYRKGDLYQIVDPLGHTTTINQYDASGRPLQMTDANGIVTAFTYSNRGWLTSQTVTPASGAGQTTNYGYDAVGQLTKVTLPDSSTVSFSYDGAHRLTGAADSQGNSISYTLDAMGNRTQEQAKDPNGNLARQVTRVFDSMNRPLKVTAGTTQ